MEDSEKTTDSMLLEEAISETEKIGGDGTDESIGTGQDLVEGGMESEDVEMADGVAEDSENNNLAPEDSMDAPATILEGDGDVLQGTLSTTEGYQFISQTDALIVQNEPPQQLMEEADIPGEEGDGITGEDEDTAVLAEADTTDKPRADEDDELNEGEEETLLLQQEQGEGEEGVSGEEQGEPQTVDLSALPEGITLISDQDGNLIARAEGDDEEEHEDHMELRLEEDETENGAEDGTEGDAMLGESDQLEGALNELEGKIAAAGPDGSALLAGQENLQGMQLMEGDDKPEEEAAAAAAAAAAAQEEIQAQLHAAILKQEEMKIEQEEDPEEEAYPGDQTNAEADALATLASAALGHQAPTNGVKNEVRY